MSRWFRHYAGMMRDEKLVRVSIRSGQSIERVVWIWGAILESAAEIDDNGRYDLDAAEAAYFLRTDESDVVAVLDALAGAARLAEGRVVNWSTRQFISDRSAPRVAAYRERKRAEQRGDNAPERNGNVGGNDTVTLQQRPRNAPETETEREKEVVPNGTTARARSRPPPVPCPDDVELQTWVDFNRQRRKPLTMTALRAIKLEADKAGWTLEQALTECAARGWDGFKAKWIEDKRNDRQRSPATPNGIAAALDRRIESGGFAGSPGRHDAGGGRADRTLPPPAVAVLR